MTHKEELVKIIKNQLKTFLDDNDINLISEEEATRLIRKELKALLYEAYFKGFNNAKNGALRGIHSLIELSSTDNRTRAALEELHKFISAFEAP
jgi:hypothetical protein